jgi:hypothetical protein
MEYTDAVRWDCTGGCAGDCNSVPLPPVCYRTYECKTGIRYTFAECTNMSETGPVPLDCYGTEDPWSCWTCVPNYSILKYTGDTTSSRCQ